MSRVLSLLWTGPRLGVQGHPWESEKSGRACQEGEAQFSDAANRIPKGARPPFQKLSRFPRASPPPWVTRASCRCSVRCGDARRRLRADRRRGPLSASVVRPPCDAEQLNSQSWFSTSTQETWAFH